MSPRVRFWAAFPNNSFRNEPPEAILGCFFPRNSYRNEPPGATPGCFSKEFLWKRAPGGDSGLRFQGIPAETSPRGRFWVTFPRNSYRNQPPGAILAVLAYLSKEFL